MDDVLAVLQRWNLDRGAVREQVYRAPTPRERERWHAVWLLAGGWTIWGWVRAEVTANTCFGTAAKVREHVGAFFRGLADRTDEVQRRCRTVLQTQAEALAPTVDAILQPGHHADPTLARV